MRGERRGLLDALATDRCDAGGNRDAIDAIIAEASVCGAGA